MFDWFLSISAVIHMLLMGNKWRWAPLLGAFLQIGWIVFAITTKQHGFIVGACCFIIVNLRNHFKWQAECESKKTAI